MKSGVVGERGPGIIEDVDSQSVLGRRTAWTAKIYAIKGFAAEGSQGGDRGLNSGHIPGCKGHGVIGCLSSKLKILA